jgi:hypothetical protein
VLDFIGEDFESEGLERGRAGGCAGTRRRRGRLKLEDTGDSSAGGVVGECDDERQSGRQLR